MKATSKEARYKLIPLNNAWVIQDLHTFKLMGYYSDEETAIIEHWKLNHEFVTKTGGNPNSLSYDN